MQGRANNFDTVINFLYQTDLADGTFGTAPDLDGKQNVISYFLTDGVVRTHDGYAEAGGTQNAIEIGENPEQLVEALRNTFNQILWQIKQPRVHENFL